MPALCCVSKSYPLDLLYVGCILILPLRQGFSLTRKGGENFWLRVNNLQIIPLGASELKLAPKNKVGTLKTG